MTSKLDAASLFRVDGMVAAITGGGTGKTPIPAVVLAEPPSRSLHHRPD